MSTLHHHVLNAQPRETYAANISSFMRWVQERIAKEVEENERVEAQTGTRDFIPTARESKKQDYTEEEKINIVKTVDRLKSEGHKISISSKEMGIHDSTYYRWKKELNM